MNQNKTVMPAVLISNFSLFSEQIHISVEKLWLITFQTFLHRITQENRILVATPSHLDDSWGTYSVDFDDSSRFSDILKDNSMPSPENHSTQITFQYNNGSYNSTPSSLSPTLSLILGETAIWSFDPTHYSQDEIVSIPDIFIHFAENLSLDFNQPCAQISLLSREQWDELESLNRTEFDFPSEGTLHELISAQATRSPERIAAIYNSQRLSYGEMEQRSNGLAHILIAAGIMPGQVVGLYLDRDLDLLVAQLAILKAGAAYAALDLLYPREMLIRLFNNFDMPFVLTNSELNPLLPKNESKVLLLDQLFGQKDLQTDAPQIQITSQSKAFIIFTSGSTGTPKGVIHTHRNMLARFQASWALAPMNSEDVIGQTSPLSSVDAVDEIYSPFLLGARIIIIPYTIVTDPRRLVDLLEKEGVTRMILVPVLLRVILTAYEDIDQRLKHLKTWLIGGEALTSSLVKFFYEKLPHAKLINFYGLTEGDATFYPVDISESSPPVGRPIQNTHVYVLDSQLRPLPPGLPGEIHLSGEGLFKEYWNRPDLNSEKWQVNPYNNSRKESFARLFKTGDLGRWQPNGQLQYLGRRDRMVKIRSFRVELGEVEAVLAANPAVRECAVRVWQTEAVDDAVASQPRIIAYVVLRKAEQASPAMLREGLKEHLPDYAMPKQVILLDSLPLLSNGKIDYLSLPEPKEAASVIIEDFSEPNDELELFLVRLWERLLKRHPISTRDNFFDLGGDSLIVIIMITELEKELGQTLSLALLFHTPTIIKLAEALREKGWKPIWSSLVPIQSQGSKPPLFCVHADGGAFFYNRFTSHISPEQPLYGIQARGLDGKEAPFTNVKEMAAQYIKEIRLVQPKGPYIISGFSMGGVVIYEMAQQLQREGEKPSLVIFLDAPSPNYPEMLEKQNKSISKKIRNLLDLPAKKRLAHLITRFSKRWRELQDEIFSQFYLLIKQPLPPALRIHVVRKTNQLIADLYQPTQYSGDIIVLSASEQIAGAKPDQTLGWGQYVTGTIHNTVIPGNHETIFQEPNVGLLAQQIQISIDNWLEKNQTS